MNYIEIHTKEQFDSLIKDNEKVVVDYWAPWCGPCKNYSPFFEKVAGSETLSDVKFAKVNIDNLVEVARDQGIRGIPTTQVFQGGTSVRQKTGVLTEQTLEELIKG